MGGEFPEPGGSSNMLNRSMEQDNVKVISSNYCKVAGELCKNMELIWKCWKNLENLEDNLEKRIPLLVPSRGLV